MGMPESKGVEGDEAVDVMQWLAHNRQWLTIAASVVVVGGGGWWIYNQSRITKEVNASKALSLAKQSIGAQNPALAKSDLEKLVARYGGTGAGSEGAMLFAHLDYDQSKYQEGITILENATKAAPQPMKAEIRALMGDGYLSLRNPTAAAIDDEKAADLTDRDLERANQRAPPARPYATATDSA